MSQTKVTKITCQEFADLLNSAGNIDLPKNFLRCIFNSFDEEEVINNITRTNPFYLACLHNKHSLLEILMELPYASKLINQVFGDMTLLGLMTQNSNLTSIKLLLEKGADPSIVDKQGCTAKYYANCSNINNEYNKLIKEICGSKVAKEETIKEDDECKDKNESRDEKLIKVLTAAINILKKD